MYCLSSVRIRIKCTCVYYSLETLAACLIFHLSQRQIASVCIKNCIENFIFFLTFFHHPVAVTNPKKKLAFSFLVKSLFFLFFFSSIFVSCLLFSQLQTKSIYCCKWINGPRWLLNTEPEKKSHDESNDYK